MILKINKLLDEETYRFLRLKEIYRKLEADEQDCIVSFVSYIKKVKYYNGKISKLINSLNRHIIENKNPIPMLTISNHIMISSLKKMENVLKEFGIVVSITKIRERKILNYNINAKMDNLVESSEDE